MDSVTHPEAQSRTPGQWGRLAWLPIPLLLVAIIAARMAGLSAVYENHSLLLVLSFTFYTLVSLGTLYLIGRSFLSSGLPGLLLLVCGVILWSLSGTIGDLVSHGDSNINVTIFNTGIWMAGLCHLAGAIFALRPQQVLRAKVLWLTAGCAFTLGALWLVSQAALSGWLPVFFIPGHGGTALRYFVLSSAIAMFVLSSALLHVNQRASRLPFTYWYALALLLLAVGLFGVMVQLSLGSVVNWLSRSAQWLGGLYLLFAAIASLRESQLPLLPPGKKAQPAYYRDAIAVAVVLAAAAIRLIFLSAMGTQSPYLVFFPAVMFAAIYGGLRAGILATALSAVLANYFWVEPVGQLSMKQPSGWLAIIVFLLSGAMIAWVADSMHRARASASASETQVLLAAEREAASEALCQSEARFRELFNTLIEGFCVIEVIFDTNNRPVDYRFLECNPAFEAQTGLHNVQGHLVRELVPENEEYWFEIYGKIALTGEPERFVNETKALNRWYEVYAYRVGNPQNRQVAIVFNDISVRKRAEEVLRNAHDQLETLVHERTQKLDRVEAAIRLASAYNRSLIEVSLDPLVTISAEGKITDVNVATETATGCSRADLIGTDFSSYFTDPGKARAGYGQVFREGSVRDYDLELRHRNGRVTPVLYNASVYHNEEGKVVGVFAAARDITEQKRAQISLNELNQLLEQRIKERTAELQAANESLRNSRVAALNLMEDAFIARKEAEKFNVELQQSRDELETRVQERTADLKKINEALKRSNFALEDFAHVASHDLQEPLRKIMTFSDRLVTEEQKGLTSQMRDYLVRVQQSAERMQSLVRDLAKYSHITSGKDLFKIVNLRKPVEEAVMDLKVLLEENKGSVEIGQFPEVEANEIQMHQLFMNLIGNALKYRSNQEPVIKVFSEISSKDGFHDIHVEDNGIGFDEMYLDKIFKPFQRLHGRTSPYKGTGMGLAICRRIVEYHGGSITAKSEPGKGSTFIVRLPKKHVMETIK